MNSIFCSTPNCTGRICFATPVIFQRLQNIAGLFEMWKQSRRKRLKLVEGAPLFKGNVFRKLKGAFPDNKKGIALFIAESWRWVLPVPLPVPTSMCENLDEQTNCYFLIVWTHYTLYPEMYLMLFFGFTMYASRATMRVDNAKMFKSLHSQAIFRFQSMCT